MQFSLKSTSILQMELRWMRQIESFRRWKYFWKIRKQSLSMFLKYLNGAKSNYSPKHFMLALCNENPSLQTHSYVAGLFLQFAPLPHNNIFSAHSFISMKEERKAKLSAHSTAPWFYQTLKVTVIQDGSEWDLRLYIWIDEQKSLPSLNACAQRRRLLLLLPFFPCQKKEAP